MFVYILTSSFTRTENCSLWLSRYVLCIFIFSTYTAHRSAESARLRQRALGEIFEKLLTIRVFYYRKLGENFSIISLRWGKFSIFTADSAPLTAHLFCLYFQSYFYVVYFQLFWEKGNHIISLSFMQSTNMISACEFD